MKQIIQRYLLITFLLLFSLGLYAQVDFKINAPEYVHEGNRFKLSLTLNEKPDGKISLPPIKGFQILMGPSVYSSTSMSIVNGSMSTTKTYTYSYVLLAEKKGKYTIPSLLVDVDGKTYNSTTKTIEVLEANASDPQQNNNAGSQNNGNNRSNQSTSISKNKSENFFVKVLLTKNKLYPNQHTVATLKLYTRYGSISNLDINAPTFKGFLSKEVPNSAQNNFTQENINGIIYNTAIIGKYVLFPQQSGKIKIDDFTISALAQQRVNSGRSIFDDFFGDNVQQFKVMAKNPVVSVQVSPFPLPKPSNFKNAVGKFDINTSLSADSVNTNEAVTFKVTIKGNGNLQMIKAPNLKFSPDLEVYDPKTDNKSGITSSGMNGSTTFEYLIIPRQPGNYEIPSISFTYFNPSSKSYETINTKAYSLKAIKGEYFNQMADSNMSISRYQNNQQDVTELGRDIKYIKTKQPKLQKKNYYFWGSSLFWLLIVIVPLLALLYIFLSKQRNARSADVLNNKKRRANKVAIKRLRTAKKSLELNNKEEFYNYTLEALWGFVSDKLHLPKSELNKDNIQILLAQNGVPDQDIADYIATLNDCEMAQYAPISTVDMKKSYQNAINIISKLEENI